MTGGDWSLIGVALSVIGTLVATYGARVSSNEAKARSDQLVEKSSELATSNAELAKSNAELVVRSDRIIELQTELTARSDTLASRSDEIATLSQENARLSQELAAYTTGGDSYFYLHVSGFGGTTRARMQHVGQYPVRDSEVSVWDITDQIAEARAGRQPQFRLSEERNSIDVDIVYPHPAVARSITRQLFGDNLTNDNYVFFVHIGSGISSLRQLIQFVRVGGNWRQAYIVEKVLSDGETKPLGQYIDPEFPASGPNIVLTKRADFPQLR